MKVFIDFEVTSRTDLSVAGLDRYRSDPTTRAYCMGWAIDDGPAELWTEADGDLPAELRTAIASGAPVWAHNAQFDRQIWNLMRDRDPRRWPAVQTGQWHCSAALARYHGLPGSLDAASRALGSAAIKDVSGKSCMMQIALHPEYTQQTHPELFERVHAYALDDIAPMQHIVQSLPPLPAGERANWLLDLVINERGIPVDVDAAEAMEFMKSMAEFNLNEQVSQLTHGRITAISQVAALKDFTGIEDSDRGGLLRLLARDDIRPETRALAELRLQASRSPKKSAAILRAHVGGRMRFSTVYHGALSGRSSARGCGDLQSLNFARPRPGRSAEDCEQYLEWCREGNVDALSAEGVGPELAALADAQRSLVCAPAGFVFGAADLTGIEGRLAPWLAGDEAKLADTEAGRDSYKVAATDIYGIAYEDVDKQQRQVGKCADLALGYHGGVGAFVSMGRNFGVQVPDDEAARIVQQWRAGRPMFARWWSLCDYSAKVATDQPGREVRMPVGRDQTSAVYFCHNGRGLEMRLPSGRAITYHGARIERDPGSNRLHLRYDSPKGYREELDSKILSNNMTQGLARDLFWAALHRIDRQYPIVHHIYDEVIALAPADLGADCQAVIERELAAPVSWAPGLPLGAAGYHARRWRKD